MTVLFGNGLGMALDPEYFALRSGIRHVWGDSGSNSMSEEVKRAITMCLPLVNGSTPDIPESEDQLSRLHEVVSACDILKSTEGNSSFWLTDKGLSFPNYVNFFIGLVGNYFHQHKSTLTKDRPSFIKSFAERIRNDNIHVATLNYDDLLYSPLIEGNIMDGYHGELVDGFWRDGFKEENLERKQGRNFGWYLHLHGSPLFVGSSRGQAKKLTRESLQANVNKQDFYRHIVLTHTKVKPEVISGSAVLASYWDFFGRALSESRRLIVFGYSGEDTHVNKAIKQWQRTCSDPQILIVEWTESRKSDDRLKYWRETLKEAGSESKFRLVPMENILDIDWLKLPCFDE